MKNTTIFLSIICITLMLSGCKKDYKTLDDKLYPITVTPIVPDIPNKPNTLSITWAADSIISKKIEMLQAGSRVNFNDVAKQIKLLPGVKNAYLTDNSSSIVMQQTDSLVISFLLTSKGDIKNFKKMASTKPAILQKTYNKVGETINLKENSSNELFKKNVLIIAPFQKYFDENLSDYRNLMANVGVTTTILKDELVTLDVFKNNYLQNFDIIEISTHGGIVGLQNDKLATGLCSGVLYNEKEFSALPKEERDLLAIVKVPNDKNLYLSITAPYLGKVNNKRYNHAFIFANACSSSQTPDLANYFKANGVSAYMGFRDEIDGNLANSIAAFLFLCLEQGATAYGSYTVATSHEGLCKLSYANRITERAMNVKLLDYQKFDDVVVGVTTFDKPAANWLQSYGHEGDNNVTVSSTVYNLDDVVNRSNYFVFNTNTTVRLRPIGGGDNINLPTTADPTSSTYSYFTTYDRYQYKGNINVHSLKYPQPVLYFVDILQNGNLKKTGATVFTIIGE